MVWQQVYDPLSNMWLSTLLAAIPVVVMLVGLGFLHMKAHLAAGAGLIAALLIAVFVYNMPGEMAGRAALFGIAGVAQAGKHLFNAVGQHLAPCASQRGVEGQVVAADFNGAGHAQLIAQAADGDFLFIIKGRDLGRQFRALDVERGAVAFAGVDGQIHAYRAQQWC